MSDFVIPTKKQPRETYTTVVTSRGKGWPQTHVTVLRDDENVYEYDRNYSMLKTFEPFRQFRDGVWCDYALISPKYVRFEVLDLEKGEVIAVEPYPAMTEEWQERILKHSKTDQEKAAAREKYPIGKEMSGAGFCPVEFYVPDWWEDNDDSMKPGDKHWDTYDETPCGDFAVYSGCVWGDDTSWKIRYIDLSRISEGIVTSDERFGYVELGNTTLKEAVTYEPEGDRFNISVGIRFKRDTGKASHWDRDGINWDEKKE